MTTPIDELAGIVRIETDCEGECWGVGCWSCVLANDTAEPGDDDD